MMSDSDEVTVGPQSGSFTFKVPLAKVLKKPSKGYYSLPNFDFGSCAWSIFFEPKNILLEGFTQIGVWLQIEECRKIAKTISANYKFTADLGDNCVKERTFEKEFIIRNDKSSLGYGTGELFKIPSNSGCFGGCFGSSSTKEDLHEATLTLKCKIWLGEKKDSSKDALKGRTLSLITSLTNLHENSILPDIKIKVAGSEKEIQAHRAILANRSPVFLAMFDNNMKEAHESIVNIEDFEEEPIQAMIEYMYSGKVERLEKMDYPIEVLKLSEKYQLNELKTICENKLAKSLKVETVIETLAWAEKLGARILKGRALEFVVGNSTKVFETKGYLELDSAQVFREINKALVKKK